LRHPARGFGYPAGSSGRASAGGLPIFTGWNSSERRIGGSPSTYSTWPTHSGNPNCHLSAEFTVFADFIPERFPKIICVNLRNLWIE